MRLFINSLFLFILGALIYLLYLWFLPAKELSSFEKLELYFEEEIDKICKEQDLPAEYFKALVILESSAEKPSKSRFEPHVFQKLIDVKKGIHQSYGSFSQKQLLLLSENTIRKLATSWGPIQIMGYHCKAMGITIQDLKGEKAMYYAILFAKRSYGAYLKKGDFSNAFHIHNTGHALPPTGIPDTFDPEYISKGLNYVAYFRAKKIKKRK